MFNYFKQRFSKNNKQKANSAFTLAELLVASAISAVVLGIAYSLVNVILSSNKSDNTTIGLNTKIENALDFVVDDASHRQKPTEVAFETLFPLLREDGLYAIEDWGWAHWANYQGPNAYFADEPALTNTIFKLLILHTCRPDIISEIRITPVVAFIRRGPAALQSGSFSIDKLLVMRDKELPAI